jgi:hypothetical protein
MIVIAGDDDNRRSSIRETEQRLVYDLFRFRRGRGSIEQVARDDYDVDGLGPRDSDDFIQHRALFVGTAPTTQHSADVPIGGVQKLHRTAVIVRRRLR